MPTRKSTKTSDERAEARRLEKLAEKREDEERRLVEHNAAVRRAQESSGVRGKPGRVFSKPRAAPAPKIDETTRSQIRAYRMTGAVARLGMPAGAPSECPNCGAGMPCYLGRGRYHCQVNRLVAKLYGCDHTWDGPINPSETRYRPPGAPAVPEH